VIPRRRNKAECRHLPAQLTWTFYGRKTEEENYPRLTQGNMDEDFNFKRNWFDNFILFALILLQVLQFLLPTTATT